MLNSPTTIQQKMRKQVVSIYESLMEFGYPQLINKNIMKGCTQIQQLLSQYFQPTPKRQNLIEWLILQIYPFYQRELDKADKKANRKKKIFSYLWKLGVMPFSKHTKNLDYQKYLQGLIGMENSINLIFNLSTLMVEGKRYQKSKIDNQFHCFLQDIYKNYDSLINIEYDPYKISFPAAYQDLNEEQFNENYRIFLEQKIAKLKDNNKQKINVKDCSFQSIFKEFQQNKNQFQKTYSLMIDKIKETLTQNKNIVQSYKNSEVVQSNGRTIYISPTLPKLYKQYKQKIKLLSFSACKLGQQKQQIIDMIICLNQKAIV